MLAYAQSLLDAGPDLTCLEEVLTHPAAFGLTTATPVQRAICRVADGRPLGELEQHPDVMAALGCRWTPVDVPKEWYVLAGIRGGKSLIAAATAVRASQLCDVSRVAVGDEVRIPILSLSTDLARAVFSHLVGNVTNAPALRPLLVGEPTADSVTLRHPSGCPIEIKVTAGSKAGASVVARYLAGAIFDEAPRMVGRSDGVVNFDDTRVAALGRLLPGAQLVAIGSPWAPFGPIYDAWRDYWGKPSADLVVWRAPGPVMNPREWTPEKVAEFRDSTEQGKQQTYRTDVLCEFVDLEMALFDHEQLDRCRRPEPGNLPPEPGWHYVAAMDPATRGNAWTLVVVGLNRKGHAVVAHAEQWQGSKDEPLRPSQVLADIAAAMRPYKVDAIRTDQWAADALRDIAHPVGLSLIEETVTRQSKVDQFGELAQRVAEGTLSLPPDRVMLDDLRRVSRKVTQTGVAIEFPRTADGRHCDYAPCVAMAVVAACQEPDEVRDKPETYGQRMTRLEREKREAQRADEIGLEIEDVWLEDEEWAPVSPY